MKKLLIILTLLVSMSSHAAMLGSIEQEKEEGYSEDYVEDNSSRVYIQVMSGQAPGKVGFNIVVNGSEKANYRQIVSELPVDVYYELFNTGDSVSGITEDPELDYRASGSVDNRVVVISRETRRGKIKTVAIITIDGAEASLNVKTFNSVYGNVLADNKVSGLSVKRDGVWLFDDSQPLGKVITKEGLEAATSNSTVVGLKTACEANCDYE